jgi:hypothetical protein
VGGSLAHAAHLGRRFVGSLSSRPPNAAEERWAQDQLLPSEVELWRTMSSQDRRHAIEVAQRFAVRHTSASRAEMAGALLHDVGKVDSGLGTFSRVAATLVPERWCRGRYARYHQHEAIGAAWCRDAGSDPVTAALVADDGSAPPEAQAALHDADEI